MYLANASRANQTPQRESLTNAYLPWSASTYRLPTPISRSRTLQSSHTSPRGVAVKRPVDAFNRIAPSRAPTIDSIVFLNVSSRNNSREADQLATKMQGFSENWKPIWLQAPRAFDLSLITNRQGSNTPLLLLR